MLNDVKEVLVSEENLDKKVTELADKITKDFTGKNLVVIGVLKGANVFVADLIRKINIPMALDFMAISSYGSSTVSSGVVKILKDLDEDIEGRHVLVVEDIIDTGLTLSYLTENLKSRGAKSIDICTLLDKPDRRKTHIDVKYKGFDIPDEFVVGYGIDFNEKYRNLPFVGILKREAYE
ncbi:hypoxanthine phosphoribosyltransferase [Vallitalea sp.]|jgi:hypoxanthine phosphoribosyltransferase|uniref:hypoxanthine phosphoribosyltransferase n=1 Tax=Vallitalea sp. TaxID=1882829 RepID=UPI0025CD85BC|nr:hypoxanthine phosphoribosyltransferase [Vallitalea sp.]MCT4686891.1 hypoxanthine phosphoribosyltransferase [Vallitalea sp.]